MLHRHMLLLAISNVIWTFPFSQDSISTDEKTNTALIDPGMEYDNSNIPSDFNTGPSSTFSNNAIIDAKSPVTSPIIECTPDVSENDSAIDIIEKRFQNPQPARKSCPSGLLNVPSQKPNGSPNPRRKTPVGIPGTSPTSNNPCDNGNDGRTIHVSCKGGAIGRSVENAEHVLDCVPGQLSCRSPVPHEIQWRTMINRCRNIYRAKIFI